MTKMLSASGGLRPHDLWHRVDAWPLWLAPALAGASYNYSVARGKYCAFIIVMTHITTILKLDWVIGQRVVFNPVCRKSLRAELVHRACAYDRGQCLLVERRWAVELAVFPEFCLRRSGELYIATPRALCRPRGWKNLTFPAMWSEWIGYKK